MTGSPDWYPQGADRIAAWGMLPLGNHTSIWLWVHEEMTDTPTPDERADPNFSRRVVEAMYPRAGARRAMLSLLAESIALAHFLNPDRWTLSLFRRGFTFNVGRIYVLRCNRKASAFVVDRASLDATARTGLSAFTRLDAFNFQSIDQPADELFVANGDVELLVRSPVCDAFLHAHHFAIENALRVPGRPGSNTRAAHSVGLLDFLRAELDRPIPDAGW